MLDTVILDAHSLSKPLDIGYWILDIGYWMLDTMAAKGFLSKCASSITVSQYPVSIQHLALL